MFVVYEKYLLIPTFSFLNARFTFPTLQFSDTPAYGEYKIPDEREGVR